MAKTRFIRKRIISVRNIYKITRTMERVAQSKVMKLSARNAHAGSFRRDIAGLLPVAFGAALNSIEAVQEMAVMPLTAPRPAGGPVLLFLVTSSRGLCGGYNSRVIQATRARMDELKKEGRRYSLAVMGKKGNAYFRFYNQPVLISVSDADENVPFSRVDELAEDVIKRFLSGEFDAVEVVAQRFKTKAIQEVRRTTLLPFDPRVIVAPAFSAGAAPAAVVSIETTGAPTPAAIGTGGPPPYLIEPSRQEALDALLPFAVKVELFSTILGAFLSEQAQRAIAMRSASDNAQSMIKRLTLVYNRARQAQITNEMIEIVSGSEGSRT